MYYARIYVDLFETTIEHHLRLIKKQKMELYRREFWINEAIRTFRYSFFLRYYALFESHLRYICERIAQEKNLELKLQDIRGKSFLDRFNKYIALVANLNPVRSHQSWDEICIYAQIRNIIIHNNGNLKDLNISNMLRNYFQNVSSIHINRKMQICMRKPFCCRVLSHMAKFIARSYL